ncbi:MAG: hypothetical protein IPH29_04190 [Candidatus Microthrix sp.]|jgi:hypothetical protein|nr:hypothetical protein [Candidatus Microthrix sp.]
MNVSAFNETAEDGDISQRAFILADSDEPRGKQISDILRAAAGNTLVVQHEQQSRRELLDVVSVVDGADRTDLALRDTAQVADFLRAQTFPVTIDISCLPHAVWSAFVRGAVHHKVPLTAWYVEPSRYETEDAQIRNGRYLSRSVGGAGPLPGFSTLATGGSGDRTIVFLLGFEGSRLGHMAAALDAFGARVHAVVADPGFKDEYVATAMKGNLQALSRLGISPNVHLERVPANEPLEIVRLLDRLGKDDGSEMIVVPLGPRTHALGAVIYYLQRELEGNHMPKLVYDHAVRNPQGSSGMGRIFSYSVLGLISARADNVEI